MKVGIIGITGYTAEELLKILQNHPHVSVHFLGSGSATGKSIKQLYPDLSIKNLIINSIDKKTIMNSGVDCMFLAVPHGTAMTYVPHLLEAGIRVIDLSADYRFADVNVYEKTYQKHMTPELCDGAVYGLSEWFRDLIAQSDLVGNPGCYVTASLLAVLPLKDHINDVIIDAKSGISGAGRTQVEQALQAASSNNFKPYKVGQHRHQPEIETYLGRSVEFVPHLLPIFRGIESTIYFKSKSSYKVLYECLVKTYHNEPFVKVIEQDPEIALVRNTNSCFLKLYQGTRQGDYILVSVIDNLMKGASGQAVQNMNIMFGFNEADALLNA